jgi:DNA-binding NtrC family response regulator
MLLVDDNVCLARFTARHLERAFPGLVITLAGSCTEAREAIAASVPDVLLIDHRLPDGDGAQLACDLGSSHPRLQAILTSASLPDDSQLCDLLGARGLTLQKPFEVAQLLDVVSRALNCPVPTLPPEVKASQPPPDFDAHLIRNRLAALLAGIRAYGEELRHSASSEAEVCSVVSEYEGILVSTVMDLRALIDAAAPPRGGLG